MTEHIEVKGIRDGKAHCKCGWVSAFAGRYKDHRESIDKNDVIEELERICRDLSWLGAQGNLPEPDTAWAGVTACREVIKNRITELRSFSGTEEQP